MIRDQALLVAENLMLNFGKVQVLDNISLDVMPYEILAIIGPNGAGKTAFLNCINRFYRPQSGKVCFDGKDITKLQPYKIAELGVARTFQQIQLYMGLSSLDNIISGRHIRIKYGALSAAFYFGRAHKEEIRERHVVEEVIELLELEPVRKKPVGILPYGLQKRVDLARALASDPRLLLLDEPMAGMNLDEKADMARFIIDVHELKRIPIILVEHDMGVVMDISDRVIVFDFGHKIADGTPTVVRQDPTVIKAYLGVE